MTFDLMNPGQLMQALGRDLILMAGAMVAMIVAAWKAESAPHQRTVGYLSLGVIGVTVVAVLLLALVVFMTVEHRPLRSTME